GPQCVQRVQHAAGGPGRRDRGAVRRHPRAERDGRHVHAGPQRDRAGQGRDRPVGEEGRHQHRAVRRRRRARRLRRHLPVRHHRGGADRTRAPPLGLLRHRHRVPASAGGHLRADRQADAQADREARADAGDPVGPARRAAPRGPRPASPRRPRGGQRTGQAGGCRVLQGL
ncbi:MAG: hypothetical protein AVDCRST_MAG52-2161, partial [uncultured Blastococcus sp.]